MRVAFRVDASLRMGTGHVVRCLTLADALRTQGADCRFIQRAHPGHMIGAIRARGYAVIELQAPPSPHEVPADSDYALWLGVSQAEDAKETISALKGAQPDWLIVDHYGLDAAWERCLRSRSNHIAVIDDLACREHDADLLLDQNYSIAGSARYDGLLPDQAMRICGPDFALLNPAYAQTRRRQPQRTGSVDRVLIFFGGTDPKNMTGMALDALSAPTLRHLAVDVVIGANNPYKNALAEQARNRPQTTLHGPRPHLADLMARADLGIGAGGVTTWERCSLGLPSVVISLADNQRPACEALAQDGLISYVGHWEAVTADKLATHIFDLVSDSERLQEMASTTRDLVDGEGAGRVGEKLKSRT